MRDLRHLFAWLFATTLLVAMASNAAAQQNTTATYGDWVVQCRIEAGPPPQRICDMAQLTQVRGKNIPFSRVALAHAAKGQPIRLVVQVPVNVSLRTDARIQVSGSERGLAVPFDRCVPAGCFADFELNGGTIEKFRAATGVGKLSFADAGTHDIVVPLSFKGFRQAFDALSKE